MSRRAVVRVGDRVEGHCNGPGHQAGRAFFGTFTTGSPTVTLDGRGVVRVGDTGLTDCGHTFVAITGSGLCSVNGKRVHRVGDQVRTEGDGIGTTVAGSSRAMSD